MASRSQSLHHLSSVRLFRACSQRDLQRIAKASTKMTFPAGKVLVEQGDQGREAFVVLEGTAAVKRNGRKFTTLGPGDYVGELSLLDKGPRTATVVAETPMTALVLSAREFTGLVDQVPGLAHKLMSALATRVRELDSKLLT